MLISGQIHFILLLMRKVRYNTGKEYLRKQRCGVDDKYCMRLIYLRERIPAMIDSAVYGLYNLTEDDIKLAEGMKTISEKLKNSQDETSIADKI